MRRIVAVTGSRAESGVLSPLLEILHVQCELTVVVTGMHHLEEFGSSGELVARQGWNLRNVDIMDSDDGPLGMALTLGRGVTRLAKCLEGLDPDIVLVIGDRVETLAAALAASFSGYVVAHIQGGDVTEGGLDEYARHAITKVSHIHFPATEAAAERIRAMGEDAQRIHMVGTLALDGIDEEASKVGLDELIARHPEAKDRFVLFVMHPISTDPESSVEQALVSLESCIDYGLPVIGLLPNADAGGRRWASILRVDERVRVVSNLPRSEYLALLRRATALVGNSSSGMIEAPALGTPVVNVGRRQAGRQRGSRVVDVPEVTRAAVLAAIETAASCEENVSSPYEGGPVAARIANILLSMPLDKALRQKRFVDLP